MNKYINKIINKISQPHAIGSSPMAKRLSQPMAEKGKVYKIIFLGDSITSTEWVHPNFREIIEYVLKDYIEETTKGWKAPSWFIRTINSALNGGTSNDFLFYLTDYVISYKPDLVILQGTRNDFTLNISVTKHIDNMNKIINKILNNNSNVVFIGTTPSLLKEKTKEYLPYIKEAKKIAEKNNIQYVDLFYKYQELDLAKIYTFVSEGNSAEGIKPGDIDWGHPNQLGNAYIAKILLEDIFDIKFNPELYINETQDGKMYPKYR